MAVKTDTIEGVINESVWFHYDIASDVLYLRRADARDAAAVGEETDDGLIILRREADDALVGITVVSWWSRFGHGDLPDSLHQIESHRPRLATRLAA